MIDKNDFLMNFAGQFENTKCSDLTYNQNINELEEWSSLVGLGVMAMIRDVYQVNLYIRDIELVKTIEDLYQMVNKKRIE